ncbi:MAG: DoxX family protein [Solirubrobacteraceae bacterium]
MRRLFGPVFVLAGIMHFVRPGMYESIVPDYLPAHRALVYASGVAEIAGGAGVLHPATRRLGSWWSIATLLAVFPANVQMAQHPERYPKLPGGRAGLIARLPLQAVLIAWARAAGA